MKNNQYNCEKCRDRGIIQHGVYIEEPCPDCQEPFDSMSACLSIRKEEIRMKKEKGGIGGYVETPETTLEKIGEQIKKGYVLGRIDKGSTVTAWEIKLETWKEN